VGRSVLSKVGAWQKPLQDHGTVVETLLGYLMHLLGNVEISGVLDRPQLNGLFGTIQCFSEMKRAYMIRLCSQATLKVTVTFVMWDDVSLMRFSAS